MINGQEQIWQIKSPNWMNSHFSTESRVSLNMDGVFGTSNIIAILAHACKLHISQIWMFRDVQGISTRVSMELLGIRGHPCICWFSFFLARTAQGMNPWTLEELQEWAEEEKLPPRFRAGPGRKWVWKLSRWYNSCYHGVKVWDGTPLSSGLV